MIEITRQSSTAAITASSSAASTTPRIPFGEHAGGGVFIANTNGATQILWHASAGAEDTPVQIYEDGTAVATSVVAGAHPIPDACYGFAYVAPVIVGSTALPLTVSLKG